MYGDIFSHLSPDQYFNRLNIAFEHSNSMIALSFSNTRCKISALSLVLFLSRSKLYKNTNAHKIWAFKFPSLRLQNQFVIQNCGHCRGPSYVGAPESTRKRVMKLTHWLAHLSSLACINFTEIILCVFNKEIVQEFRVHIWYVPQVQL